MLTNAADAEDVLSMTLARMKLKALSIFTLDAAERWAIEVPAVDVLQLHAVLAGDCFLAVDGEARTYHVRTGDCFLVPHAKGLVMAGDRATKRALPLHRLKGTARDGVLSFVCNGGGRTFSMGAAFQLDGHFQQIVFGRLPSVIHIPAHDDHAAVLRWSLERFSEEARNRHAGCALMLSHLVPIMLLQALRGYLASANRDKNWFVALAEPRLSRALAAMQFDYAQRWSLESLARRAGLSRAGFASNFKSWIGVAPMDYLAQWRMQVACELLLSEDRSITDVSSAVGYESESAFSAAFTRIVGLRPGVYRKTGSPRPRPSWTTSAARETGGGRTP